ncbi:MAG: butyrate kinase [Bacteroidales bacterium]|nr:butyrate kinase [Bacteroidales bacterium]
MLNTKILVIYPEVTKTKMAIYQNGEVTFLKTIRHKPDKLESFNDINDQLLFRVDAIMNELKDNEIELGAIKVIMARGGLIKPLKSGIYEVNEQMKKDLRTGVMGRHATNLGGLIADEIAKQLPAAKAYLGDPVVVDELDDLARVSGHPLIERKSIFHCLNHKYVAREYSKSINKPYNELNLIVAHIGGGGISIGAHRKGKVVDVNQAFDGDGPFAVMRSGSLPVGDLVELCFSGKYTREEVRKMITDEGGLSAYLGTSSLSEIEMRLAANDEKAWFYVNAMAYQVAKEIGAMATVLEGKVDSILLTGNILNNKKFTDEITRRVDQIAPITVYPIVNDLDSLASNGMLVLKGQAEIIEYV